jgi:poly(hydroxyalkanoate) granule-associated protein
MRVEATVPETLQGVEPEEVQRQINAKLVAVSTNGRRLALAYVGLWGCAYDRAAGAYRGGIKLWEDAVQRGQRIEQTLQQRVGQLERRAAKQFNVLQNRVGDNVEQVTRTVSDTGESFEVQLEKQVERVLVNLGIPTRERLERLNQEIDRLNAKLDEELARQEAVHA